MSPETFNAHTADARNESHPCKTNDSNYEPRGVGVTRIFANIEELVTRFGVVEDRVGVDYAEK